MGLPISWMDAASLGRAVLAALCLLLAACGGGGSGGGASAPASIAWLSVSSVSEAQASNGSGLASIGGSAFVSKDYVAHKHSGLCLLTCLFDDSYPGVDVWWENQTLALTGAAHSRYGTLTNWDHLWNASIPLATGSNTLVIHAQDPAGNSASTTMTLGYVDTTPPTVQSTSPASGATTVARDSSLAITFSEAMDPASISTATIQLKDSLNRAVSGSVAYSDRVATFTPSADLLALTAYTATVGTGVRDLAGNALASAWEWSFSTSLLPDNTPPTVATTEPANGAQALTETNLTVTFSEAVQASSVNAATFLLKDPQNNAMAGTVYPDSLGRGVFSPATALAYATTYTATLTTGILDLVGNPMASNYTWSFTTQAAGAGQWHATATDGAPTPRSLHTAVWTGTQMLVWGGQGNSGSLGDGARYDPISDSWQPMSGLGAPSPRSGHVAVWTGNRMIIWGGGGTGSSGAIYDPARDTWQAMSQSGAPAGRGLATAVWTGTEMIVWGGTAGDGNAFGDGGRYNPDTDSWSPVSTVGAPSPRYWHTAVWTGSAMLIWGGQIDLGGGIYTPATDSWSAIPASGAPATRCEHTAVWSGSEMIVWGGWSGSALSALNSGGRYNPATNTWQPTTSVCAPLARCECAGVWTGAELILWGGRSSGVHGNTYYQNGGIYSPATDAWLATPVIGAPDARSGPSAVWSGTDLIVWGGDNGSGTLPLGSGGRYRPQ